MHWAGGDGARPDTFLWWRTRPAAVVPEGTARSYVELRPGLGPMEARAA